MLDGVGVRGATMIPVSSAMQEGESLTARLAGIVMMCRLACKLENLGLIFFAKKEMFAEYT